MNPGDVPRFRPSLHTPTAALNDLSRLVAPLAGLQVRPPLSLTQTPAGYVLQNDAQQIRVEVLKTTSATANGYGYPATVQKLNPSDGSIVDGTETVRVKKANGGTLSNGSYVLAVLMGTAADGTVCYRADGDIVGSASYNVAGIINTDVVSSYQYLGLGVKKVQQLNIGDNDGQGPQLTNYNGFLLVRGNNGSDFGGSVFTGRLYTDRGNQSYNNVITRIESFQTGPGTGTASGLIVSASNDGTNWYTTLKVSRNLTGTTNGGYILDTGTGGTVQSKNYITLTGAGAPVSGIGDGSAARLGLTFLNGLLIGGTPYVTTSEIYGTLPAVQVGGAQAGANTVTFGSTTR